MESFSMRKGRRRSSLSERRRKLFAIKVGAGAFALLSLFFSLAYLSGMEQFTLGSIEVRGASAVSVPEVEDLVKKELQGRIGYIFARSNFLLYPREQIRATVLNSFKRVESIAVDRSGLTTLVVSISERTPYGLWCGATYSPTPADPCFYVDRTGLLYAPAADFSGNPYIELFGKIEGDPTGAQFVSPDEFEKISEFIEWLPELKLSPRSLAVNDSDASMYLDNGAEIRFSRADELSKVKENLAAALTADVFDTKSLNEVEYIDLRFGNKAFYKFR